METQIETKIVDLIMVPSHLYLLIGVFGILSLLKKITPISDFLFVKNSYLVVPISLALSCIGVFALGLTEFTTFNLKVILVIVASAVCTFGFEAFKNTLEKIADSFGSKKPDAPTSTATPPSPPVNPQS